MEKMVQIFLSIVVLLLWHTQSGGWVYDKTKL
jgi:hypothetical protein